MDTAHPHPSRRGRRQRPGTLGWLTRRWPTAVGVTLAALTVTGISSGADIAPIVTASGFVYLGSAALQRRDAAWPLFLVSFLLVGVGFAAPGVDASWWMLALVGVLTAYGVARGALRPPWGVPLQAVAMVVLAAAAITAVHADQTWAGLLVGGGLLAHAAWDVYHHHVQRVVSRSMAEFCAVLDTVVAVPVLAVTFA